MCAAVVIMSIDGLVCVLVMHMWAICAHRYTIPICQACQLQEANACAFQTEAPVFALAVIAYMSAVQIKSGLFSLANLEI
jgi:hypothetical protein